MLRRNLIVFMLIFVMLTSFAAANVLFNANIPNENNIKVGDSFDIQVSVVIPTSQDPVQGGPISVAGFTLKPNNDFATIKSAVSAKLFPSTDNLADTASGDGWKFEDEDDNSQTVTGTKLLVTLKAVANKSGPVTFTFSNMRAEEDIFTNWSTSGVPKTITIKSSAPPAAVCGNSKVEGNEKCDDGNLANGDGCSSTCQIEVPPAATCGDSKVEGNEQCDDGNTQNNDGCSSTCQVESGYTCNTPGQKCTQNPPAATCGNSVIESGEKCDDGNAVKGDGCSDSCQVESGYTCPRAGQKCTKNIVCGDGKKEGSEACDDSNTNSNDGCSSQCQIEAGYECKTQGQLCSKIKANKLSVLLAKVADILDYKKDSSKCQYKKYCNIKSKLARQSAMAEALEEFFKK